MGDVFLLAVAAAFYPTLLAIVIVILQRPRPVRLLVAYLVGGMIVGIGAGCVILFVLGGAVDASGRQTSPIVDLVAGLLSLTVAALLAAGVRPRRRRARKQGTPWTRRAMQRDSVALAFVLGLVLDLPSIWYLVALKDIAEGDYGTGVDLLLIVSFNLIMFALIEVPLAGYLLAPETSRKAVGDFNVWLKAHSRQIVEALAGGVGAYLSIRGLVGLL
jgi:hypothetical protein